MAEAAARLGHDFARSDLLMEALTHPSMAGKPHNQRLEFLGDRVLGLVIAEALIAQDTAAEEGQLAPRLNALVRNETCAEVAAGIDLPFIDTIIKGSPAIARASTVLIMALVLLIKPSGIFGKKE